MEPSYRFNFLTGISVRMTQFTDYHGEACQWLWRNATGHAAMYNLGSWSEADLKDAMRWMLRYDAGDPNPGSDPMFGEEWGRPLLRPEGPPWPLEVVEDWNDVRWQFLRDKQDG